MTDKTSIAYMEREATRQESEANKEHRNMLSDLRAVCGTPQGRKVINQILAITEIYSDSFTGNSQTFFNEGKRSVGLQILALLNDADPEIYIKLLKYNLEQNNDN